MEDTGSYVHYINNLLKNIKSTLHTEFIQPCARGISITTNNVPATSNLTMIEKYFKLIKGINNNEVLTPHLLQSKFYFKIIGIPYIQPSGNNLTSNNITNFISHTGLFKSISLASKPRVIKAFLKSDIAIVWLDIWDSQNRTKTKLLINHSFNFSHHIATIRGTSMNPSILQCHNCWK